LNALRRVANVYRAQWHVLSSWRPGRRALIRRTIVSFVIAFIALGLTVWILPGLTAPDLRTIVEATIALALINLLIRPAILAIFVSISVVAIAVATLVFQIAVFFAIAWFIPEFNVAGIVTALIASFVFAGIQSILSAILAVDEDESFYGVLVAQLARNQRGVVHSDTPGVVIVQIDGLAHPILAHQIRAGRVNFISRWIRSGEMRLDSWVALLPSQTSASQAGILHGNNSFIPAFRWWEKSQGRMLVSNHPEDAAEIVRRASDGEGLLSNDGASVGNLVSGDAVRSYVTMATIKDKSQGLGQSTSFAAFFASPTNYIRTINLTIAEVIKEYVQARRSHRAGVEPSMHRGMPYPVARAGTNVALRALATSLVMEEMYRGAPVIYVDYTDYDEIAHHSGPERGETLDALDGVDRTLASLRKAADDAPRPYRFILLSDHGQSLGATFKQRYDKTLEEVISDLTEAAQTGGATGAITRAALGSRTTDGSIDLVPKGEQDSGPDSAAPDGELPELVVCASGNLALIYFPRLDGRVSLETLDATWPGLVEQLAAHPGIGFLMVRSERDGTVVVGARGRRYLADDRADGEDPTLPFGEHAITGLRRVDGMEHCGDLVAISLLDDETDEVAAFEELIGSHGGLGGFQTQPFIMHPTEWPIDEPIIGAEAVYRQIRRWLEANGIPLGDQSKRPTTAPGAGGAPGTGADGAGADTAAAPTSPPTTVTSQG
jgi:uncharacterized membrane protein YvlD (DUF360 family)